MRFLVSCTDAGSLKEVICDRGTDTSVQTAKQPFYIQSHLASGSKCHIQKLLVLTSGLVLLARSNGDLELVKTTNSSKTIQREEKTRDGKIETEKEIEALEFELLNTLHGLLDDKILEPLYENSKKRRKLEDAFVSLTCITKDTFILATRSGMIHVCKLEVAKMVLAKTFTVKAPLEFAHFYDLNRETEEYVFGYGGEENLVKLIKINSDFTELHQIWEAKNVKNDRLDMRVPVWPIALKFLKPVSKSSYQFAVTTHWSHLAKYNTAHGRKPVEYIDLLPKREPIAHLEVLGSKASLNGNAETDDWGKLSFLCSDLKKNVYNFDKNGRLQGKYGKDDITGFTTFMKVHDQKYLLTGGLDKYLRVFDIKSAQMLTKVYMGSNINLIEVLSMSDLELPDNRIAVKKRHAPSAEGEDEDGDELWHQLEREAKKKTKGIISKD